MPYSVLITGGAGYIGSNVADFFHQQGHQVIVIDDLSTGFKENLGNFPFYQGDIADGEFVDSVMKKHHFTGVLHFAGSIIVPESVELPLKYYHNNTLKSKALIQSCLKNKVPHFLFSSTAAVYGEASDQPLVETSPLQPLNPYGRSKLMTEWMLQDTAIAHQDFHATCLRYFNVAGASKNRGQRGKAATHLIKVASQVALGQREALSIFGDDYDTPDGTCIRDYIHVTDLAQAHLSAFSAMVEQSKSFIFNCGYGHGLSVKEVVQTLKEVSGIDFLVKMTDRRPGDAPSLVADSSLLRKETGWNPQFDNLKEIVLSAFEFEKSL